MYIDGDHTLRGITIDLVRTYAKVRPGGLIGGDAPLRRYGLGLGLHPSSDAVFLEWCDTGVSFRSVDDPARDVTRTAISNTTVGAWDVSRLLARHLGTSWS